MTIKLMFQWIFAVCVTLWAVNDHLQATADQEGGESAERRYMTIFRTNKEWTGVYVFEGEDLPCYMYVHSSHPKDKDGLIVTFKDKDATLTLEGTMPGNDELEVVFSVYTMYESGDKFHANFTMRGKLSMVDGSWWYQAIVTVPKNGSITDVRLHPADAKNPTPSDHSNGWRYAIVIGIPLLCAVVGIVGTIAIIYWAKKKGYIRHVPKTYDNFSNAPVSYDNNKQNVHI